MAGFVGSFGVTPGCRCALSFRADPGMCRVCLGPSRGSICFIDTEGFRSFKVYLLGVVLGSWHSAFLNVDIQSWGSRFCHPPKTESLKRILTALTVVPVK